MKYIAKYNNVERILASTAKQYMQNDFYHKKPRSEEFMITNVSYLDELNTHLNKNNDKEKLIRHKLGYHAYIWKNQVQAESYLTKGNDLSVILYDKESNGVTLFVDAQRNLMPTLAFEFKKLIPIEILLYETVFPDRKFWECGLNLHD
jgi:hypothetical protein